jgi:hypothetical protein
MKGIELPINALIIITVAVLVLLGIVALWMSGWGSGSQGVTIEAAKAVGCSALLRDSAGCTAVDPALIIFDGANAFRHVVKFDADGDGTPGEALEDNLQNLCNRYYGTSTAGDCRKVCGCGA